MRMKTRRLLERGEDIARRTTLGAGPTGPNVAFGPSDLSIVDDLMIDFQARAVLYEEGEFELPDRVESSIQGMRRGCVEARQRLAGKRPRLSLDPPFDWGGGVVAG